MGYQIPLFKLNFDQQEVDAVTKTIESTWISMGPQSAEFEKEFATRSGAGYALSMSNCTVALHLGLLALGIKPGDEVLVPSLSFAATANCVRYVGAKPVFCDIEGLDKPHISLAELERKVNSRTKAIIPMHYAGFPCDMDTIMEFAGRHNLRVMEDACHGPFSKYKGRALGSIGDIGCFSFFSNKNISTGEGGMLLTSEEFIYDRVKLLRSHGMTTMSYERSKGHSTSYDVVELGFNARLDDIRASIGLAQLPKLEADYKRRAEIRRRYLKRLSGLEEIIVPFAQDDSEVSNYIFPIVVRDADYARRDQLRSSIAEEGVQTSVHYPAIHRFSIYADDAHELPLTETYSNSTLTLPMYSQLTDEEVDLVCDVVENSLKRVEA